MGGNSNEGGLDPEIDGTTFDLTKSKEPYRHISRKYCSLLSNVVRPRPKPKGKETDLKDGEADSTGDESTPGRA